MVSLVVKLKVFVLLSSVCYRAYISTVYPHPVLRRIQVHPNPGLPRPIWGLHCKASEENTQLQVHCELLAYLKVNPLVNVACEVFGYCLS